MIDAKGLRFVVEIFMGLSNILKTYIFISGFTITVSLGRYFISAFSTRDVSVNSSTTACARACFAREGFKNNVILCFVIIVIVQILQLIELLVKYYFSIVNIREISQSIKDEKDKVSFYISKNNQSLGVAFFRSIPQSITGYEIQMCRIIVVKNFFCISRIENFTLTD